MPKGSQYSREWLLIEDARTKRYVSFLEMEFRSDIAFHTNWRGKQPSRGYTPNLKQLLEKHRTWLKSVGLEGLAFPPLYDRAGMCKSTVEEFVDNWSPASHTTQVNGRVIRWSQDTVACIYGFMQTATAGPVRPQFVQTLKGVRHDFDLSLFGAKNSNRMYDVFKPVDMKQSTSERHLLFSRVVDLQPMPMYTSQRVMITIQCLEERGEVFDWPAYFLQEFHAQMDSIVRPRSKTRILNTLMAAPIMCLMNYVNLMNPCGGLQLFHSGLENPAELRAQVGTSKCATEEDSGPLQLFDSGLENVAELRAQVGTSKCATKEDSGPLCISSDVLGDEEDPVAGTEGVLEAQVVTCKCATEEDRQPLHISSDVLGDEENKLARTEGVLEEAVHTLEVKATEVGTSNQMTGKTAHTPTITKVLDEVDCTWGWMRLKECASVDSSNLHGVSRQLTKRRCSSVVNGHSELHHEGIVWTLLPLPEREHKKMASHGAPAPAAKAGGLSVNLKVPAATGVNTAEACAQVSEKLVEKEVALVECRDTTEDECWGQPLVGNQNTSVALPEVEGALAPLVDVRPNDVGSRVSENLIEKEVAPVNCRTATEVECGGQPSVGNENVGWNCVKDNVIPLMCVGENGPETGASLLPVKVEGCVSCPVLRELTCTPVEVSHEMKLSDGNDRVCGGVPVVKVEGLPMENSNEALAGEVGRELVRVQGAVSASVESKSLDTKCIAVGSVQASSLSDVGVAVASLRPAMELVAEGLWIDPAVCPSRHQYKAFIARVLADLDQSGSSSSEDIPAGKCIAKFHQTDEGRKRPVAATKKATKVKSIGEIRKLSSSANVTGSIGESCEGEAKRRVRKRKGAESSPDCVVVKSVMGTQQGTLPRVGIASRLRNGPKQPVPVACDVGRIQPRGKKSKMKHSLLPDDASWMSGEGLGSHWSMDDTASGSEESTDIGEQSKVHASLVKKWGAWTRV